MDALQRLPKPQRQVVALHYLLDMPVADIAAGLGVPAGTVKARLGTTFARLATTIEVNRALVAAGEPSAPPEC